MGRTYFRGVQASYRVHLENKLALCSIATTQIPRPLGWTERLDLVSVRPHPSG